MCGRFTYGDPGALAALFAFPTWPEAPPRHNVAPGQDVPTVIWNRETAAREVRWMRWGLIPSWAKDPAIGSRTINARAESLAAKPAFRKAFRERRCLMPADGFYEWRRRGSESLPWYICRKDRAPFAFASLWDAWLPPDGGGPLESCTIVTTTPNPLVAPIHHRMPVILARTDFAPWLDPAFQDIEFLKKLLVPWPPDEFEAFPVSRLVNRPEHERAGRREEANERQLMLDEAAAHVLEKHTDSAGAPQASSSGRSG